MKNSTLAAKRAPYRPQQTRGRTGIIMLIICACILLASLAYASRDTLPLISDGTVVLSTADARESIIITRPPIIWSLKNQTYDYDAPVGRSQFHLKP